MEGGLYILFCRFERSKYLLNFMYFFKGDKTKCDKLSYSA